MLAWFPQAPNHNADNGYTQVQGSSALLTINAHSADASQHENLHQ